MKAPMNRFIRYRNSVTLDCRKVYLKIVRWRSAVANPDQQRRIAWEMGGSDLEAVFQAKKEAADH